jgi:hypothetical protein
MAQFLHPNFVSFVSFLYLGAGKVHLDTWVIAIDERAQEGEMGEVVYVSRSRIERKQGPLRLAHIQGEAQPVVFSVHGAIAEHYKVDPAKLQGSHAATIDYVIAATAG